MTAKQKAGQPPPTWLERRDRHLGEADGHLGASSHWIAEAIRSYNNIREYHHEQRGHLAAAIAQAYVARADAINYRYRDEERNT